MKFHYVNLTIRTLGTGIARLISIFTIGLAVMAAVFVAWPLLTDWIKTRPPSLTMRYGKASIRYDRSDGALDVWQICQSVHSSACFIVGTTKEGDVVEGAPLLGRLRRSDMSASQIAHLAGRAFADDPSGIVYEPARLRAYSSEGLQRDVEAPAVHGDTIIYWTYTNPPGPCAEREIDLRSGESKRRVYNRCVEIDGRPR